MVAGALVLAASLILGAHAFAQSDPLPSWNNGPAKKAIIEFVQATTTQGDANFVRPADRIATFDQDGTLWVEHPMYSQVMYCLERVPALVKAKPKLAKVEPFNTVLSGNREAIARLRMKDLEKILTATLTGMSVDEFDGEVKKWIANAKDPRWKRPYTELTYLPMQELLKYLRDNRYKTYIVTGCGQDFVRVYSERTYGIPPEQVVGTAGVAKYGYDKARKPFLIKEPKLLLNDNNAGKPEGIHLDARVHDGGRRRAAWDAGLARRRAARIRLRPRAGASRHEGRRLYPEALRRGEAEGMDRHQYEERLEAGLRVRVNVASGC